MGISKLEKQAAMPCPTPVNGHTAGMAGIWCDKKMLIFNHDSLGSNDGKQKIRHVGLESGCVE